MSELERKALVKRWVFESNFNERFKNYLWYELGYKYIIDKFDLTDEELIG